MTMFSGPPTAVSADKSKKPEEWTNRFNQQLKSVEHTLSVLYDALEKDGSGSVTNVNKDQNVALDSEESFPELSTAFIRHCQNLVCMMSEPTNGPVRLPVGSLLNTVSRCLRVSYAEVKSIPSLSELAGALPALHRAGLELLSQLVLSCKTSVLPQSRVIIDLSMQALTSASSMDPPERSQTRAYAYQALCLVVQIFGWGKYLKQQCRSVIQELMKDIKWQNSAKKTVPVANKDTKQQDMSHGKKIGRKKRNNKAESYVDLMKTNVTESELVGNSSDIADDSEATLAALELAKVILGQAGFLSVESLVRCVVDTARMFRYEHPPFWSPYTKVVCKKGLYSVVFACATVRLEPSCCSKDAVTHFQMTNQALDLLVQGMQTNCSYEVQSVCKDALNVLQLTGNLNRPIVRRIQPQEHHNTRDEAELEGEIEKLREDNENLQRRLLDSEMEIQMHKSQLAALRKELEDYKSNRSKMDAVCADQKVYLSDPGDNRLLNGDIEDLPENSFEEDESENEEDKDKREETRRVESIQDVTGNGHQQDKADRTLEVNSESVEGNKHKRAGPQGSRDVQKLSSKRKCSSKLVLEATEGTKKSKVDDCNNDESPIAGALQDMISDFVDASPDSD